MCPKWMDGPAQISGLCQMQSQKVLTPMNPGAQISEMDDHMTRILPQIDDYNSFVVSGLVMSQPPVIRTPDIRTLISRCANAFRDFCLLYSAI
jgi:hypothetical protein